MYLKSRSFSLFTESIKSPQTRIVYVYSFHEFIKFTKIKEYDDILKLKPNQIQKLLENWVLYLKNNGRKGKTIKAKLSAVELFLEMNKVYFYKKILHKLIPSDDYIPGGDIPFTNEDIQEMLESTTKLRTKALIHFLASTGTRPGVVTDPVLRKRHLIDMPRGCKAIKIYDNSKEGYWAFLTPEASKSLDAYIYSRQINGEDLTEESPLFANLEKNTHNKENAYLSAKSVRQLIANVLETAAIKRTKTGNRYDKAVIYGFRKRFNTILKLDSNINSNIAEKLMAHKRGLDGTYLKPTRDDCFNEFVKAIPHLTIKSSERQKLIIEQQKQEISDLETKQQKIEQLEKSVKVIIDVFLDTAVDDVARKSIRKLLDENLAN